MRCAIVLAHPAVLLNAVPIPLKAHSLMLALLAILPLCATQSASIHVPPPPAESVASGAHFRVTAHFEDDKIAAEALAAAESVWSWTVDLFGAPEIDDAKPLEVHLYRTFADYEAAEEPLTHGAYKRNLAFTSDETGAAYIALQPDVSDSVLERIGLPLLTRQLIAHEAVHVIVGRAWPNHATLPLWLKEGSATWICEQAMKKQGWIQSAMDDPMHAARAVRVKRLEAEKKLPSLSAVFGDLLGELEFNDRYSVWDATFAYLSQKKQAGALTRILAGARQMGGGATHAASVADLARAELSKGGDLAARDREWNAFVRALAPRWDEVLRSLDTHGDTFVQVAFTASNAICWRAEDVGATRYEISGELEIFPGSAHQQNLLLARTPNGFVQVAFTADYGVDVFEYDNRRIGAAQWKKLGTAKVDTVVAGKTIEFLVRVSKSKLSVDVAGKKACEVDTGDRAMQGAYGLGAVAGSAGTWRKVQLKKG